MLPWSAVIILLVEAYGIYLLILAVHAALWLRDKVSDLRERRQEAAAVRAPVAGRIPSLGEHGALAGAID